MRGNQTALPNVGSRNLLLTQCVMDAGRGQQPSDEQGKREEWSDILCPSDNGAWVSVSLCQT